MDESSPDLAHMAEARRLAGEGRYDEAVSAYRQAIAVAPDNPLARQHLGVLLGKIGRLAEAEEMLRAALAMAPGDKATCHSLAGMLMAQGRYAEGWSYYGARFDVPGFELKLPTLDLPRWQSFHPANKQILVLPEQGFGDQIQFSRFVPWLVEQGARVTFVVPLPLERLFRASFPIVQVAAAQGMIECPDPDFWIMSADLPGFAGATPDTLPPTPYLVPPPPPSGLPEGFRVGVMTHGNPKLEHDAHRSLSPEWGNRLRRALPGTVVELAPEETGARDFADTAALVGALDLVVAVDTAVAHLAGALGKPCFLLNRLYSSDWRWPRGGKTTPWYSSISLYWSTLAGDWARAIDQVAADAHAMAAA